MVALQKELETYNRLKQQFIADEGRFVLICGDAVDSIWDTYDDALRVGYQKFGLAPFMVKKIGVIEPVHVFSRSPVCPS
jgi:hypothetical protein